MKSGVAKTLYAVVTALVLSAVTVSALPPVVLSKDASGVITNTNLSLLLKVNPSSDATQRFIPDGSKLVSDNFVLKIDDRGLGTFRGFVKFVTPDGKVVLGGVLEGVAGLTVRREDGGDSRYPGHLVGIIHLPPVNTGSGPKITTTPVPTTGSDKALSATDSPVPNVVEEPVCEIIFMMDLMAQSASPVPMYRGHLDGLVTPPAPPPPPKVMIRSDRLQYPPDAPVMAIIENGDTRAIQGHAFYSYCTIVRMERLEAEAWKPYAMCLLTGGPAVVIKPGERKTVLLPPDATVPAVKDPGTYRLTLAFEVLDSAGTPLPDPHVVVSPPFQVLGPDPGRVVVASAKPVYSPTEPIVAHVKNASQMTIRVFDMESFCSIIKLQLNTPDGWKQLGPCAMDKMPTPVYIKPGEVKTIRLPSETMGSLKWPTGAYRAGITFAWVNADLRPVSDEITTFSEPFNVVVPTPNPGIVLTTSKREYKVTEPIPVAVANRSNMPAVTEDHRSFCTILYLQAKTETGWVNTFECQIKSPTMKVTIPANAVIPVILPINTVNTVVRPGTYRAWIAYSYPDSAGTVGEIRTSVTEPFLILN